MVKLINEGELTGIELIHVNRVTTSRDLVRRDKVRASDVSHRCRVILQHRFAKLNSKLQMHLKKQN